MYSFVIFLFIKFIVYLHKRVLSKGKLLNTFTRGMLMILFLQLSEFEQVKYCEILSFYNSWVLPTFCNGK